MRMTTLLASASAIAFIFAIGSVSAADQFTTLKGVKAALMSSAELNAVKGMDHHFRIQVATAVSTAAGFLSPPASTSADPLTDNNPTPPDDVDRFETDHHQDANPDGPVNFITIIRADNDLPMDVAPSYRGLAHACVNSVIVMPGFIAC